MNENPFASPRTDGVDQLPTSDVEETRREHLSHEASIQSIGYLYYLGALIAILVTGFFLISQTEAVFSEAKALGFTAGMVGILVALIVLQIWVGRGLRSLKKWVKIPVTLFSCFGLLSVPFGTIINGYILYLIFSRKGKVVFSEEYAEVIAQTPHIKYKSSKIVVLFLVALLVLFALVLGSALLVSVG